MERGGGSKPRPPGFHFHQFIGQLSAPLPVLVGDFRTLQQGGHFNVQPPDLGLELGVAKGLTLSGSRANLGAVQRDGSQQQQAGSLDQPQQLHKYRTDQLRVFPPKLGDRIMLGMRVSRQIPHGEILMSGAFNLTRTEHALRITVHQ